MAVRPSRTRRALPGLDARLGVGVPRPGRDGRDVHVRLRRRLPRALGTVRRRPGGVRALHVCRARPGSVRRRRAWTRSAAAGRACDAGEEGGVPPARARARLDGSRRRAHADRFRRPVGAGRAGQWRVAADRRPRSGARAASGRRQPRADARAGLDRRIPARPQPLRHGGASGPDVPESGVLSPQRGAGVVPRVHAAQSADGRHRVDTRRGARRHVAVDQGSWVLQMVIASAALAFGLAWFRRLRPGFGDSL